MKQSALNPFSLNIYKRLTEMCGWLNLKTKSFWSKKNFNKYKKLIGMLFKYLIKICAFGRFDHLKKINKRS